MYYSLNLSCKLLYWIWRKTSLENQIHTVTLAVKTFYCTSTSIQIYWLGNGVWSTCHFIFIVTITFGPICSKKIREREKEILHRNHHKVAIEHSIIEVTVLKKQFPAFHFTFCLFHNIFLILIVILVQQLLNGSWHDSGILWNKEYKICNYKFNYSSFPHSI